MTDTVHDQDVSLREAMLADHARLEALLDDLSNAADGAPPDALLRSWRALERGLGAHLMAEEEQLFPLLGDAELVRRLTEEHAGIRAALDELGLSVELHYVRKERVDDLVRHLRAHADREDRALYAVADERWGAPRRRTFLDRLRGLVDAPSSPNGSRA